MEKEEFKKYSKEFIQDDRIEFLLKKEIDPVLLRSKASLIGDNDHDLLMGIKNQLSLMIASIKRLQKEKSFGTILPEQIEIRQNKINLDALLFIDQLAEVDGFFKVINNKETQSTDNKDESPKSTKKPISQKQLVSNLKQLELIGTHRFSQNPLIGIFSIPPENENIEGWSGTSLLQLIEETDRIEKLAPSGKFQIPQVFTFKGTQIQILQDLNEEQLSYLKNNSIGVSIGVIQINAEFIPHINSLSFLGNLGRFIGLPIIFVLSYINNSFKIESTKSLLKSYGFLLEEFGGTFQAQEVILKTGEGIEELIEKFFLEVEVMDFDSQNKKKQRLQKLKEEIYDLQTSLRLDSQNDVLYPYEDVEDPRHEKIKRLKEEYSEIRLHLKEVYGVDTTPLKDK